MENAIGEWWRRGRGAVAGSGAAAFCAAAQASGSAPSREAGSRITAEYYDLHLFVMYAAVAVFVAVFAVMVVSMLAQRRAAARACGPFHRSAVVEFAWAAVPWVVVFGLTWPATRILTDIDSPARAQITIKATGLQWKWGYQYVKGDGEGITFFSNVYSPSRSGVDLAPAAGAGYRLDVDNPVVVPVGKTVRVVLEANQEIHSWHVPDLGVKQYAVPGLVRDTWFRARETGTFRGLCSIEACGAGRACTLIVVKVVSEDDYRRWVEATRRRDAPGEIRTQAPRNPEGGSALAAT